MEDILKSFVPLGKDSLIKRLKLSPDDLRKAVFNFVYKIAPKYECPDGLGCHVVTPNRNCIYYNNIEEEHFPKSDILIYDDIQKYENFYGFCPNLLDFIFFVFDNLEKTRDFSRENHDCDLWTYSSPLLGYYYEREFKQDETISEKRYIKCVICGRERVRINLEQEK